MIALSVAGVSKRFDAVQALSRIDLSVAEGEFLCLLGPTNAGKSTLLKTIAGLHRPDEGRIIIYDRDVTELQPASRNVSLLVQTIALFPNRSGFDNIAFPLRQAGMKEDRVTHRVHEVAKLLKIAHVLGRLPRTYSGGERQRVAIGRAIAHPQTFCYSMNLSPIWMPGFGSSFGLNSVVCTRRKGRPSSTLPMIKSKP